MTPSEITTRVTIAIPTLNRVGLLKLSLESALAQTHSNLEVLLSNNASTDGTAEFLCGYASDPRVRVLTQTTKLSMVGNWNECVRAATGKYFLMLSDDDLLEPEAIAAMLAAFEAGAIPETEIGVVYCRGRVIDENGVEFRQGPVAPHIESADDLILEFFEGRRLTWACCILFRHSDMQAGYTDELPLATDAAQWMQAVSQHGKAVFLDRFLASYRMHRNTTATTPVEAYHRDLARLAEMAITDLRSSGFGDDMKYVAIREAARRLQVRMIPDVLNQRFGRDKLKALQAYGSHRRYFASRFGLFMLAVGLTDLLVPQMAPAARRVYAKLRGR